MAESSNFHLLSYGVQRWIYRQGWETLRAIQEKSAPLILTAKSDVLITAPTAGGKTEAAFLPIVSWLESDGPPDSYGVLCLSPLKALINDQFNRLELLCESAQTSITPWHGDISSSVKKKSWKSPSGILMTTPESLEAMFVTRSHELLNKIKDVRYIVIDEFHAFIDRERGQQLLSLLSRIEELISRKVVRIALSATIGDPRIALEYLRPDACVQGVHLDVEHEAMQLQLMLKSYIPKKDDLPVAVDMAEDLFGWLRGTSNLVFANSRRVVEEITDHLRSICTQSKHPLEFYPHHGSLSRDARLFLETRLKDGRKPTTAVATSTLELGLDIGDVASVAQIGAPSNVSSLRQRLGRSGRRHGAPAILRMLVTSHSSAKRATPVDLVEAELVQTIAVTELMLKRWVEPPNKYSLHLSTLIQQILSMIAFRGGITATSAFHTLCKSGPWQNVNDQMFARVLRGLGQSNVIAQLQSGELVVGEIGEQIVSSHTFYTAFEVPEEYRLVANGKILGTLPLTTPYIEGQLILFGGRRWSVASIDADAQVITLIKAKGGAAPMFGGEPAPVHKMVRQTMNKLYRDDTTPKYCCETSGQLLFSARQYFKEQGLFTSPFISEGGSLYWFVWDDDRLLDTIKLLATANGAPADRNGPCVVADYVGSPLNLAERIADYLADRSDEEIGDDIEHQPLGKFDEYLSDDLIAEAFVREKLDLKAARQYINNLLE